MAYISKQSLLQAYKVLSHNTSTPTSQGATQAVSAIRYLFALDRFQKKNSHSCDTKSKIDRDAFVEYVGGIVSINGALYTCNFHTDLKEEVDYKVGSNFFSVNVVKDSIVNPIIELDFPRRSKNGQLFNVKNGVLSIDKSLFVNAKKYMISDCCRIALAFWLCRNHDFSTVLNYANILSTLNEYYSRELISSFFPDAEKFSEYVSKYGALEEQMSRPKFEKSDIMSIFQTEKSANRHGNINSILHYLTAIRTKPFLLLAGISGTGKSRIVRKLAQATNDIDFAADYDGEDRWKKHTPSNFCLIQVKPNWHNSMDVVGFKSNIGGAHYEFTPFIEFIAKAWHYPDTPFFLCLDEMNLAPVEEYFAEFLSAIESRSYNKDGEYETDPIINPFDSFGPEVCGEMIRQLVISELDANCKLENQFRTKGLTLPKNLIVMGTVNMDETTFSFSRKVLDRAMSIEMNDVDYDAFLTGQTEEDVPLLTDCNKLLVERPINAQIVKDDIDAGKIIAYLKQVNEQLEGTPFKLGYRAANEAFLYVSAAKMFGSDDLGSALDKFTVMKILSRIEGDDTKLKTKSGDDLLPAMLDLLSNQFGKDSKSISVQKLTEMNDILVRDHFVSFWG